MGVGSLLVYKEKDLFTKMAANFGIMMCFLEVEVIVEVRGMTMTNHWNQKGKMQKIDGHYQMFALFLSTITKQLCENETRHSCIFSC